MEISSLFTLAAIWVDASSFFAPHAPSNSATAIDPARYAAFDGRAFTFGGFPNSNSSDSAGHRVCLGKNGARPAHGRSKGSAERLRGELRLPVAFSDASTH